MNRITIVDTAYHQSGGNPPTSLVSRYGYLLKSDELPYTRGSKTVGEEWTRVDLGWFSEKENEGKAGLVSIQNLGGPPSNKQPTPEERVLEAERVLEVRLGQGGGVWEVEPGRHLRGQPSDAGELQVRCRKGTTRYSVVVFPR